jgi:hypothetical protein
MPVLYPKLYSEPLVNGSSIALVYIFNYLTAIMCLGIAVITFLCSGELVSNRLGRVVCVYFISIGFSRALLEIIFYGVTKPTSIFIIATTCIFGLCYIFAMKKTS